MRSRRKLRCSRILIAFAAALALSAGAAANASATLPALYNEKLEEVHSAVKFTGAGVPTIEWGNHNKLNCTGSSVSGEFINGKEVRKVVVTWTGCSGAQGINCHNVKESPPTVQSEPLKGTLAYLNKSKHEVGLRLEGETEVLVEEGQKAPLWANMTCFNLSGWKLTGQLIGTVTPVNTYASHFQSGYEEEGGLQKLTEVEGGPKGQQLKSRFNGAAQNFGVRDSTELSFPTRYELRA